MTLSLTLLVCHAACAAGERSPLTLAEVSRLALAGSEQVAAAAAQAQAARFAASQARAFGNPAAGITAGPKTAGGARGATVEMEVSQPVWTMGKRRLRGRIADLEADRAEAVMDATRAEVTSHAVQSALELVLARRRAEFSARRQQRFEVVKEYLGGHVFASPQRRAESRVVADRLRNATAENAAGQAAVRVAFVKLDVFLRFPAGLPPEVAAPWLTGGRGLDEAGWRVRVLERNPGLRANMLTTSRTGEEVRLAAREAWPDVSASAFYRRSSAPDEEREAGGGLSATLPVFDRNGAARRSLERRRAAESLLLQLYRRQLEADLTAALIEVGAAQATARAYPESLLAELEGHLADGDAEFQRGRVDLLTYLELDADTTETYGRALDAQRELARAVLTLLTLAAEDDMPAALAGL